MDPVTGALIGEIGGSLLGGLFGSSSAKKQNKAAAEQAALAYERNKEMMQSRHQWEVADLKKAGLNPVLSAGGTPSIGSATAAPVVGEGQSMSDALSSSGKSIGKNVMLRATLANTEADTKKKYEEAKAASASAKANLANAALTTTTNVQKSTLTPAYSAGGTLVDKAVSNVMDLPSTTQKVYNTPRSQRPKSSIRKWLESR